jgi:hypothetical protein
MTTQYKVTQQSDLWGAVKWLTDMVERGLAGGPVIVSVGREGRTQEQNGKCHPMIRDIARQMNHQILKNNEDQWRYFLIGNFQGQLMVPSLDGSQVIIVPKKGTKKMTIPEMSEFIEYLYSVGADYNIQWSEPSLKAFSEYREAKS